jgi:hypothetical protein
MIKDKQIPDEVAEAFIAALYGGPGLPYRKAIAAALNAWPRMELHTDGIEDWIELTLPQETP